MVYRKQESCGQVIAKRLRRMMCRKICVLQNDTSEKTATSPTPRDRKRYDDAILVGLQLRCRLRGYDSHTESLQRDLIVDVKVS